MGKGQWTTDNGQRTKRGLRVFWSTVLCPLSIVLLFSVLCPLHAEVIERVVAVVNNEAITLYDLEAALAPLRGEKKNPELRRKVLEDLIHQKLLEQEVEKVGVEVNDEELRRAVAGVLQRNQITIEMLKEELMAKGISFETYKEQLREQIRQGKFIQQNLGAKIQVTEQELRQYQKKSQRKREESSSVRLSMIFLEWPPKADAGDRKKKVREGGEIADRARQGDDFNGLGGKERTALMEELPRNLIEAVGKMEPGSVSDPILTPQGVYVVKLLEKIAEIPAAVAAEKDDKEPSNEAVWQMLFNEKMNQALHAYVMGLRKKAYVEIRE